MTRRSPSLRWFVLVAGLALAAPAMAATTRVDLLAAGPSVVRFGVTFAPLALEASPDTPGAMIPRIEGCTVDGRPGSPQLPVRIVHVAVPPEGPVTVRGFGSGETDQGGIALEVVPTPDPAWRGLGELKQLRIPDPAVARSTASLAPERARLLGVSWLRNQRVASVAIFPVDYAPGPRRLSSYGRIEVQLDVAERGVGPALAEPSDPFESVYRRTLVNYEQGRGWRRPAASTLRLPATTRAAPAAGALAGPATTSTFAGHRWLKLAIPRSGFYRVTFSQIRTLEPFNETNGVSFDSVYVYAWPGNPILAESQFCDSCDYRELATGIEDAGGDGRMNQNADAIYFYALGPNGWNDDYDPTAADSLYTADPYDRNSFVFITYDRHDPPIGEAPFTSKRRQIATVSAAVNAGGGEALPTSFIARQHIAVESPTEYYPGMSPVYVFPPDPSLTWQKFFWRTLQIGSSINVTLRTPGVDRSQPARVRVRSWGISSTGFCPGSVADHELDIVLGPDSVRAGWYGTYPVTAHMQSVLDTLNFMRIGVPFIAGCSNHTDFSVLAFVELYYPHLLVPENDSLHIETPGNGNAIYNVGPFSSSTPPRVFDITDPFAPRELVGFSYVSSGGTPETWTLSFEVTEGGPTRYEIVPSSKFNKPQPTDFTEAPISSLDNLRGTNHEADYLLIYYDGFQTAADTLLAWRRVRLPLDGNPGPYETAGVPISAVYDQFSGGRTDPTAIRNFLRAVFYNWRQGGHAPPAFVTLFGDASFDFKNLFGLAGTGLPASLVPTFENGFSGGQFATDDWLVNVDDPLTVLPDFFAGRIPAPDLTTALAYLHQKLLFYERSAPSGTYRNRVMFIADDDLQGETDDFGIHWGHVSQTAALDTSYTPDHIDRAYVYLHTYPDGPGRTKPGAKADIKNTINGDGVAIFNFIGHGSPFKLTDENVLIDTDAGTFTNATRLPLFIAASCDVGRFSDPRVQSLGERLLLAPAGGAIGVISATELAFSEFNAQLGDSLFLQLFDRAQTTGQYHEGVARALLTAKLLSLLDGGNLVNNEKYPLMGDAALRLNLPQLWVDLSLYDASGTTPVSEIRGGETVTYRGRVLDRPGGAAQAYTGSVDLLIEDSQPRPTTPDCELAPGCTRSQYDFKAGAIYRGTVAVTGGAFQGKFVVPLEAQSGPRGKIRAYVSGLPGAGPVADGVGSIRTQVSPGVAVVGDNEGPNIALSFPGGVTSVRPDASLRIDLNDPSGILITGHTIQNGIVVTVDDNTTARSDVTSTFRYAAGSYTNGTAFFTLPDLAPGSHTVKVSAADNMAAGLTALQHRSSASLAFDVVSSPPVQIRTAYLFPNPTESGRRLSGGTFVIDGPGDSVNVMVRIFTVSGRLIRELTSFGQFGQVQLPWDGLDAEGYPLANGVYLFKVYVNARDERGRSSARQHAASDGRLVILNH